MTATVPGGVPSREVPQPAAPRTGGGRFLFATPLVLVNASAIWGQAGWAYDTITPPNAEWLARIAIALMFAAAIELTGVYLAWESHEALMADQASAGLRLGSYAIGLLAGVLSFLHFDGGLRGAAFGALSALSPWLWAVWSRARNRHRLAALGMTDTRAPKLSTARKLWHPIRSLRVVSWAAWAGVTDPQAAVAGWEATRPTPAAEDKQEATQEAGDEQDQQETTQELPAVAAMDWTQKRELVRRLAREHPDWTQARLGAAVGCSDRWVRGVLNAKATA